MISNLFSAIGIALMSGVFAIGGVKADEVHPYEPTAYQNGTLSTSNTDGSKILLYYEYTLDFSDEPLYTGTRSYNMDDMTQMTNGTASNYARMFWTSRFKTTSESYYHYCMAFAWRIYEYDYDSLFYEQYGVQHALCNSIEFRFYDWTTYSEENTITGVYNLGSWSNSVFANRFYLNQNTWYSYSRNCDFGVGTNAVKESYMDYYSDVPDNGSGLISFDGKIDVRIFGYVGDPSYSSGYNNGYSQGYSNGYSEALTTLGTNTTFNALFSSIADTPLRFLYGLFNFDLFGISMIVIIMSLISGIIVFGIVKKFIK